MDSASTARLSAFLVEAKRRTYAGLDDDATVPAQIFPGSKQLEYREGDLSYRDIYFGMTFFGTEAVVATSCTSGSGLSATISALTGATFISPSRARTSAVRPG